MALVTFKVRCDQTNPGDTVFVTGSTDAMGSWARKRALALQTTANEFPVWSSSAQRLPAQVVEYKCLIQKGDGSGQARWEEISGNRILRLEEGQAVDVVLSWGLAAAQMSSTKVDQEHECTPTSAINEKSDIRQLNARLSTAAGAGKALTLLQLRLPAQSTAQPVVCGDSPSLGNWSPAAAPKLIRGEDVGNEQTWALVETPNGVQPGTAFKYVLLEGTRQQWEEGRPNRSWPVSSGVHRFGATSPRKARDATELEVLWAGPESGTSDVLRPSAVLHAFHWQFAEVEKRSREIAAAGFDAVQISPAQRSIPGQQWWTRYQPVRYEDIHGLGSEQELRAACEACKKAGLRVFGDLVFNHMQVVAGCDEWRRAQHDHGQLESLKRRLSNAFGPTFNRNDFQWPWFALEGEEWDGPKRMEGWGCGEWSELRGGSEKVVAIHTAHMDKLKACGVSGFRFDAAKHMRPEHIQTYVAKAGVYAFGEVLSVDPKMQAEYTSGSSCAGELFPTTDFLVACWLRNFLEKGEDAVDFELNDWVQHLLDVEFGRGCGPPRRAGAAAKGLLQTPLVSSNSIRFARNHDTVCNDVPFYGLGKWGLDGAQVATAWLLAAHDGTVLILADDLRASPLIREALLYRKALHSSWKGLHEKVQTIIRARRAEGGGIPLTVCLACISGDRILGFCVLNPHPNASADFTGSGCLARPNSTSSMLLHTTSGKGAVTLSSDGQLQNSISLGPREGAFFLADAAPQ